MTIKLTKKMQSVRTEVEAISSFEVSGLRRTTVDNKINVNSSVKFIVIKGLSFIMT